jgi:hypothetical protein
LRAPEALDDGWRLAHIEAALATHALRPPDPADHLSNIYAYQNVIALDGKKRELLTKVAR